MELFRNSLESSDSVHIFKQKMKSHAIIKTVYTILGLVFRFVHIISLLLIVNYH
jgi:hypothetical protein